MYRKLSRIFVVVVVVVVVQRISMALYIKEFSDQVKVINELVVVIVTSSYTTHNKRRTTSQSSVESSHRVPRWLGWPWAGLLGN